MRILSKRESVKYFQFLNPDPIHWHLFLLLVYVRIFHHCWNCTFVFLFKVQDPFLQKWSTHTELSFHFNVYLDDTKEFNLGMNNFSKTVFVFVSGYLSWQMWQKSLFFCREIYGKDSWNPAWVVFLSNWRLYLSFVAIYLKRHISRNWKKNLLLLNTKKENHS